MVAAGCSRVACCLMLLAALLCLTANARARVDCTKFVYAPSCRGVAAKRGFVTAERDVYIPDTVRKLASLEQLLEAPLEDVAPLSPHRRESESWTALTEQAPKPEVLYDWYLNSLKRNRDSAAYDY